jgi:hypothetical protein
MAENDHTRGYRDNETYRRPRPQSAQPSGDPLAELARLIGQQNESAPSYRQNGAPLHYGHQPDADQAWSAQDSFVRQDSLRHAAGASQWPSTFADDQGPSAYGDDRYDQHHESGAPQTERDYDRYSSSYGDPREAGTPYADGQYADPHYGDQQHAADPRYDDPRDRDPRYADQHYADQRYDNGAAQSYTSAQGYADPRYSEPNFGTQGYRSPSHAPEPGGYPQSDGEYGYAAYGYQDGAQPQGHGYGNAYYGAPPLPTAMAPAADEQAPAKRRGSIVTVLAVLALAVVGTAAAFGYRAMFVGTGTAVPAPVIKADPRPSKIVPATDANSKPIQDRIGVKTEKIVPRQEEPVQQAASGQPRVISPFLAGQNPQAFPPASANIAPTGGAQPAATEPKRVRTVPIKPQGAEAAGPRSSRSAVPAAQPDEANAADSGTAPMALSPTGSLPAPQRHSPARQAHAAVPPGSPAIGASPFPTPIAPSSSGSSNAAAGPYAVQVTSQRSEADARASFKSLQQQFPSVLGNRQPVIRRADLGERGTYYRAQVPFASQTEASEFCSSLKAAGGQCVIARN